MNDAFFCVVCIDIKKPCHMCAGFFVSKLQISLDAYSFLRVSLSIQTSAASDLNKSRRAEFQSQAHR